MPELEYFLVAESYSVDRDTSAISIFNVFSQLTADALPYDIKKFVAVACWICSREEIDSKQESMIEILISPPGESERSFRGSFKPATRFQHVTLDLSNGLSVTQTGDIEVELRLNDNHSATHTIEIRQEAD
jgi:hypothetical protein